MCFFCTGCGACPRAATQGVPLWAAADGVCPACGRALAPETEEHCECGWVPPTPAGRAQARSDRDEAPYLQKEGVGLATEERSEI